MLEDAGCPVKIIALHAECVWQVRPWFWLRWYL